LGLETRWHEIAKAFRAANDLFGDIVKVTPSSKVVGDMALMMVAQNLTAEDVLAPGREIAFPGSAIEMLRGDLGQPPGGWPEALVAKALKGAEPNTARPGSLLSPADFDAVRAEAAKHCGEPPSDTCVASYLMYPKVFAEFSGMVRKYGPVSILPTLVFFYGMAPGDEIAVEIERGKTLVIVLQAVGETDEDGLVHVFFELNGQPRTVRVPNRAAIADLPPRRKAEEGNTQHIGAPMPGVVASLSVEVGQEIKAGDILLTIEAMKMETALNAPCDGIIEEILVHPGSPIEAKDLLVVLKPAAT
jgi:pyruvate carboxylase